MERAIIRTMGALINIAHRQLPHNRACVIFIDGPRQQGQQAAVARLTQPEYAHCIAIGVFRGGGLEFTRRNIDEPVVDWLFLEKIPSLGKRLRYILSWRSGFHIARTQHILEKAGRQRG
jgi:hypothetical protein